MFQPDIFDTQATRSLLDQLLTDSRLYVQSNDYVELLQFVARLRNFAPFNAMLLQIQKPGLGYAASTHDWLTRFQRVPREGVRPLLILWPFGPVALVYDVQDTEGKPLPEDVSFFVARGEMDQGRLKVMTQLIEKANIAWHPVDAGDRHAGSIRVIMGPPAPKGPTHYLMNINRNHSPAVQFATLAHELGHLFLGHLGFDKKLNIPDRPQMDHGPREIEAESVAFLVCERNDVESKSQTYLTNFVTANTRVNDIDIYQVMRAAGQVETLLGLTERTKFDRPR